MEDNAELAYVSGGWRDLVDQQLQKDTFLWKVLAEMDGWDGHLATQSLYDFIVDRDGSCPYTIEELDNWLNEKDQIG